MSGRGGDRNGLNAWWWIRGALVVVIIAAVLGVFGANTALKRPKLSPVNLIGLAVMVIGLGATVVLHALAAKRERAGESLPALARLAGVLICGVGAMLVFL